ncbi:MAG: AMP-dependent synthetase and ligase [Solirubrobacterales bacterium]|nr:AMP-dependent synthetase and ligase [Solirubrobacterales bacterium]
MLLGVIPFLDRARDEVHYVAACARAGLLTLEPPQRTIAGVRALARWGMLGGAPGIAAAKHPDRVALVDERGAQTYAELDARISTLANAWIARGLRAGDGVAVLARNHRGFVEATFAAARAGARTILLNTDFAGPQIREVAEREGTRMLVHDDEYSSFLDGVDPPLGRWRAWAETPGEDTLDALIAGQAGGPPPPKPEQSASIVILTSGTTGTPKGAQRESPRSLAPVGTLLSKVPFRAGETTLIGAPLFHALGFAHAVLAMGLGSTLVLRRRFDPQVALEDLERHRASALVLVPVMLRKMLDLGDEARAGRDFSPLRIIFVAGSQLGAELCLRATAAFGPTLYNLYGSTEVAYATIATPEDLAVEPGCVGRVPRGARVRIYDDAGRELPPGVTGRIFVGNPVPFEGYTGGGTKELVDGLMSSGDVGHFDAAGRLFIDGRDDDMIVSGGENVFPGEIEELLLGHPAIRDAAVIGVEDEQWGQRLRAFVVLHDGEALAEDDVKAHVRESLARYKAPRDVVFLDQLPRNPTGKVLKRELAGSPP